jgi:hypothetical protein
MYNRSCAGKHFYGTKNEIWAGFGTVGNTKKEVLMHKIRMPFQKEFQSVVCYVPRECGRLCIGVRLLRLGLAQSLIILAYKR